MGRHKSGLERIIGGLAAGAILWFLWSFRIFPLPAWLGIVLALGFSIFPVLSGVRQVVREIGDRGRSRKQALEGRAAEQIGRKETLEKTVLQIARERRGVVTPALVALHSDLSLDEAEEVLGSLSSRGYAEMRVKENGTIDYLFHDLM